MTQINFYSGSDNKLLTACRLCAKAIQQGLRVFVYVPDALQMEQLDQLLWTFSATSFLPHCRSNDDAALVAQTPIILGNRILANTTFDVLLNLHQQLAPNFDNFSKVIEIAGTAIEDKAAARERYRNYKSAGVCINHYQLDVKTVSSQPVV